MDNGVLKLLSLVLFITIALFFLLLLFGMGDGVFLWDFMKCFVHIILDFFLLNFRKFRQKLRKVTPNTSRSRIPLSFSWIQASKNFNSTHGQRILAKHFKKSKSHTRLKPGIGGFYDGMHKELISTKFKVDFLFLFFFWAIWGGFWN